MPLESFFGSSEKQPETTGSIQQASETKPDDKLPPDGDLAYTKAAVAELLSRGGKNSSVPWENPRTGARGTVTPMTSAYRSEGQTCRDFLASYVHGSSQSWLQGAACQQTKGEWEVRVIRPYKNS